MRHSACIPALLMVQATWGQVVVQQPTFRAFGTSNTVLVPDGGAAYLGGVDSARFGSSWRGVPGAGPLLRNRAFGSELNSSRNHVRARIIDLHEMEQAWLGFDPQTMTAEELQRLAAVDRGQRLSPRVDRRVAPEQRAADYLSQNIGRNESVRRRQSPTVAPVAPRSNRGRMQELLEKGDAALAAGKIELATRYYEAAEQIAKRELTSSRVRPR